MKCKNCFTIVGRNSVTRLCRSCRAKESAKRFKAKAKEENRCMTCGKSKNLIVTFPDGLNGPSTTKNPLKCYKCRNIIKIKDKKSF